MNALSEQSFAKHGASGGVYCVGSPVGVLAAVIVVSCVLSCWAQSPSPRKPVFPGADEATPSRAHYFDGLNSQYEGSTEAITLVNLDFFKWLHDEYGMALDIYALDVGSVDDGPYTSGVGRLIPHHYGSFDSGEFQQKFPRGFAPLVEKAASFGCRLGVWLGPDGFGDTPEEEKKRTEMLISFCRDFNFMLLKLDAVAGPLRPEKQEALVKALEACRSYCPDLIVLNHRVDLGKALPHATTALWAGAETYIDVFMCNNQTAPHHRAGALARGLTPGLTRLLEDHGVCLASCLDYWEDDLILQAFNRSLLLAPQFCGNPWFLRDDEYPKLARLANLHRRYRNILVSGIALAESRYGPAAVARGDGRTRLVTLKNLSWNPVTYPIKLDESIGLTEAGPVEVRLLHPFERMLGQFPRGAEVTVEVMPFRTCMLAASTQRIPEFGVEGCNYEVIRDTPGKPVVVKLLGLPGTRTRIRLAPAGRTVKSAELDSAAAPDLAAGREVEVAFPGPAPRLPWHRKLGDLAPCPVPADAEALYEATCFAADSNALEVRALERSGSSRIPQVKAAREAFLSKKMFINRGIWDRQLFDGNLDTYFTARLDTRALRIDLGAPLPIDRLVLRTHDREQPDLNPDLHSFATNAAAEVSSDLKTWSPLARFWRGKGTIAVAKVPVDQPVRYVRIHGAPRRIAEVEAYHNGVQRDRARWKASNLFHAYPQKPAVAAWSLAFNLAEVPKNACLVVAVNGRHGNEGAYAALRVDGQYVGAPDRAVSFPSNTWEYQNAERDSNYSYYFPLPESVRGKQIEVVVLVLQGGNDALKPEAWMTAYPIPFEVKELTLHTASPSN